MKFLLDEGVPVSVGHVLSDAGHDVIQFNDSGLTKGTPDAAVCAAAESHNAILVAADADMKKLARGHGITPARFKRMGLIHFQCPKPMAARRAGAALSLIEHEWEKVTSGLCSRLHLVLGEQMMRTHR